MSTRPRYPMPDFILEALATHGLVNQYNARPPYQRNDYIGWITQAEMEETRQRRLSQMLEELKKGGLYMKMKWNEK